MTEAYYAQNLDQIYKKFDTNPNQGLTESEVNKRLELYGFNEIPKPSKGFIKIYLAPLFNWLIVIYLIGGLILLISGFFSGEGNVMLVAVTLGVVLLNCIIAIFQQFRATKKLNALRELSAPTTTVTTEPTPRRSMSRWMRRWPRSRRSWVRGLATPRIRSWCRLDRVPARRCPA